MNIADAIERLVDVCRRQHKSLSTERTYALWLRQYGSVIARLDPAMTSERKLEAFLTMLARVRDVSASTQCQAFNAICFFYKDVLGTPLKNVDALRATRPDRIRYAPTREEVSALLPLVRNLGGYPTNLITRMLYGMGLRVSEPLNVRMKDLDLANSKLFILGGKGRKDRVVRIPCALAVELGHQMDYARAIWKRDSLARIPVAMPHQLAKKYPHYQFAWSWSWLFPSHFPCRHPRTGETVRWHVLECNVQRAVREAAQKLGLTITPHCLRHSYATHCVESGVNIKALQAAMGHVDSNTTLGYVHADALSVESPLERICHAG